MPSGARTFLSASAPKAFGAATPEPLRAPIRNALSATLVAADTNVLVSAIQFGGKPKQLLDLAVDGHVDLAISEAILEETLRVLKDKFQRTPEELRETDKQLRVLGRVVTPTESINAVDVDPSDNRVLECAVAGDAENIVSGDKHLLALGRFRDSNSAREPTSACRRLEVDHNPRLRSAIE